MPAPHHDIREAASPEQNSNLHRQRPRRLQEDKEKHEFSQRTPRCTLRQDGISRTRSMFKDVKIQGAPTRFGKSTSRQHEIFLAAATGAREGPRNSQCPSQAQYPPKPSDTRAGTQYKTHTKRNDCSKPLATATHATTFSSKTPTVSFDHYCVRSSYMALRFAQSESFVLYLHLSKLHFSTSANIVSQALRSSFTEVSEVFFSTSRKLEV